MWIPKTTEELEERVRAGDLEETRTFDAKRELPPSSKNRDLAEDICAMTVEGGSIIYGIAEDAGGRLTVLSPIPLKGQRERIAQIAETSIAEPPHIEISALELDADPARGYLVVAIPPSPRAPHQVIAGGGKDHRFYGRGATGNRVLSEAEVTRHVARRLEWETSADELLDAEIARWPYTPNDELGYMYAFARCVVRDERTLEKADLTSQTAIVELRTAATDRVRHRGDPSKPALHQATIVGRLGADGWHLTTNEDDPLDVPRHVAALDIDADGTSHFFCGRVAIRLSSESGALVIFESGVAAHMASVIAVSGEVLERADYLGPVDLGIAVTGIDGASSYLLSRGLFGAAFRGEVYRRTTRAPAMELYDKPIELARELVRPLMTALVNANYEPFEAEIESAD